MYELESDSTSYMTVTVTVSSTHNHQSDNVKSLNCLALSASHASDLSDVNLALMTSIGVVDLHRWKHPQVHGLATTAAAAAAAEAAEATE
jgi:hypothetical protein